jgi:hypothetical protein
LSCIKHEEEEDTAEGSVVKDSTFNSGEGGNRKIYGSEFPEAVTTFPSSKGRLEEK